MAKNYVFTVNNPTKPAEEWIDEFFTEEKPVYVIIGDEVAPTTGTPHFQGYAAFSKKRRFQSMGKKYKAHFDVARGGLDHNIDYCSKSGKVYERGCRDDVTVQGGKRTMREECIYIHSQVKAKRSRAELIDEMPWQIEKIDKLARQRPARDSAPKIIYIYGQTGHGKTTTTAKVCRELGLSVYFKPSGGKWWPNYQNEQVTVLEEFTSCFNCTTFLQLCDATPFTVEYKGGESVFDSPYIIILSNTAPDQQYLQVADDNPSRHEAYLRRVTNQFETSPNDYDSIRTVLLNFLSPSPAVE